MLNVMILNGADCCLRNYLVRDDTERNNPNFSLLFLAIEETLTENQTHLERR